MNNSLERYKVLLDSEVLQHDEGYERVLILSGWHPTDDRRMAQVHILIDRLPYHSLAEASVWSQRGWQRIVSRHHDDFWSDLPSYLRYQQPRVILKTNALANSLMDDLEKVAASL
jgi:hypothetical protein